MAEGRGRKWCAAAKPEPGLEAALALRATLPAKSPPPCEAFEGLELPAMGARATPLAEGMRLLLEAAAGGATRARRLPLIMPAGVAATRAGLALCTRRGFLFPAAPVLAGTPRPLALLMTEGVLMGVAATRLVWIVLGWRMPAPFEAEGVAATDAVLPLFLKAGFDSSTKARILS